VLPKLKSTRRPLRALLSPNPTLLLSCRTHLGVDDLPIPRPLANLPTLTPVLCLELKRHFLEVCLAVLLFYGQASEKCIIGLR
jgi:hypothetical protein